MAGLWNSLGFAENPYFATPIAISKEGADLFVGRADEVRRMVAKWDERDGCVTIVGGNVGTGKTSFLNVCQYLCWAERREFGLSYQPQPLAPSFEKVQLEEQFTDAELLVRVLRSCAVSVVKACDKEPHGAPGEATSVLAWLDETRSSYGHSTQGGVTLAGTGFTVGSSESVGVRRPGELPTDALMGRLESLVRAVRESTRFRGVIVAIDNIETVASEHVIGVLNRYRDTLFSIAGVWWVLIGQRGLFDLIDAEAPRVSQRIKGTETTLEGLSWEDFNLAVQARIDQYRLRQDAIAPVGEKMLKMLFDASAGEIRYVFKMADEIVTSSLASAPSLTDVPPEHAEQALRRSVAEQVGRLSLSARSRRTLLKLCEAGSARPKEYRDFGFQNAPNFIQGELQPLQEKGLVSKSTQGNAATYAPRSLAILAKQFDLL